MFHRIACIICIAALAGCAGSGRSADTFSVEDAELGFAVPTQWQAGVGATDTALVRDWASVFGADVEALITEALANNPDLRASRETVIQAETLLAQSRASLLPVVSAGLSGSTVELMEETSGAPVFNPAAQDSYSAALSVAWEADLRGVNRARVRSSQAQLAASHEILQASRQNVAALTATAWFDAVSAQRQLELALRTRDARSSTVDLVQRLFDAGAVARRDVVLAQADLAAAQDTVISAENGARQAARAVEVLLGRYPAAELNVARNLPAAPAIPTGTSPAEMLRRRPDIVAAEYQVLSQFAGADAARAARWPSLTLTGGLQSGGTEIDLIGDPASTAVSLGFQLAQALFDGGLRQSQIELADSQARESIARYGSTVVNAFAQVESSRDQISALDARQSVLGRALQSSLEALQLTEARYQAGGTDLLDVLSLQQRTFGAEQVLIANQAARLKARVQLYQALGGPVGTDQP